MIKNNTTVSSLLASLGQEITSSADALVSVIDLNARIIHLNSGYESLLGLTAGECIEKRFCDLFPNNISFINEKDIIEQIISGQKNVHREESFKLNNGKVRTYIAKKFPIRDKQNNTIAIGSISTDINEYKETELKLEKSRSDLALSQQIAHMGSWEWNLNNQELNWSDELYRIFGLEADKTPITTEIFLSHIHPKDVTYVQMKLKDAIEATSFGTIEYRIFRSDGALRYIRVIPKLEYDVENRPYRLFGIIQDITEEKEAVKRKLDIEKQTQQSQRLESLGRLTGGIAHDFNNILACMLGYTKLSSMAVASEHFEKIDRYINEIEAAGFRGRDIIQQMLAFSRQDDVNPRLVKLDKLVFDSLKMLSATMPSSIEIHNQISTDLPSVKIDPVHVSQLVINLCINAKDALNNAGDITIKLTFEADFSGVCSSCHASFHGNYVALSVIDNGEGIPAKNLAHIFDPFYTTKKVGKGTGMGLSTVHGIIHNAKGHILVQSEEQVSTEIRLLFPVVIAPHDLNKPEKTGMREIFDLVE